MRLRDGRANAKGLSVLYSFAGTPDGYLPYGPVVFDKSGKIFGTTAKGGLAGYGTIFKLTPTGQAYSESVVHSFTNTDGSVPLAIQIDANTGKLVVTSEVGGSSGLGTAIEFNRAGKQTNLVSFQGYTGGALPEAAGLVEQNATFYTTTYAGGKYGEGEIVALAASDLTVTDVYDFMGGSDGAQPQAGLTVDSSGALYGTTYSGGSAGLGTVFKFVPGASGGTETVLWNFQGGSDGANPHAGVVLDASGNVYGTTLYGGSAGDGVVFSVTGGSNVEAVLHTFTGPPYDGANPYAGLAVQGTMLYGTTFAGGGGGICQGNCGSVFQVSTSGANYAVLYNFDATDGARPSFGSLVLRGKALYGTTVSGGALGYGEVYRFVL